MPFIPYSGGYILNQVKGSVAAYSLRKLRAGYTGSAIRVRRSLDSLEKDIGFSGQDLDLATLTEFNMPNLLDGSDSGSAYPNILLNPTMTIDSNSDGLADNWTHMIQTGITSTHSIEDSAQKLTITASTNTNGTYITQSVSMTAGTVFATDWWYRVSGNVKASISLVYWNGGTYVNRTDALNLTANVWTNIKSLLNLTVPSTATLVECSLAINPLNVGDTGSLWVRNGVVKRCAYLTNIGLMTQDSNADGVVDGWTTSNDPNVSGTNSINTQEQSSVVDITGNTSGGANGRALYVEIPTVAGEVVNIKTYAKFVGSTSLSFYIFWYNGATFLSASNNVITPTYDGNYNLYTHNGTAPTNTTKARIMIQNRSLVNGQIGTMSVKNTSVTKTGSSFISKWYDMSGNGNDAIQTTAASQPRIVNNGIVERIFDANSAYPTFASASGINSIANGDFSNGTTSWVQLNSTISTSNNTLTCTGNGGSSSARFEQQTTSPCFTGKKVFVRFKARVTNSNCTALNCYIGTSVSGGGFASNYGIPVISNPTINTWYTYSGIVTLDSTFVGNIKISPTHQYVDAATASGKVMEVQEVVAIDVTNMGSPTLSFDGTDDSLLCPNNTTLNFGTNPFSYHTVESILSGKSAAKSTILSKRANASSTENGWALKFGNTVADTSRTYYYLNIDIPSTETYQNTTMYNHIFVDTKSVQKFTSNNTTIKTGNSFNYDVTNTADFIIGARPSASGECFNGYIAEVALFNKALTDSETLKLYTETKKKYPSLP